MSSGIRVLPDVLRSSAFGAIGAGYTAVGAIYLNPIRIVSLKNLTNSTLLFSYDGINDHEILPASSAIVLDFTANSAYATYPFLAKNTKIYVKHNGVAPTSGSAAVSAYYCLGD